MPGRAVAAGVAVAGVARRFARGTGGAGIEAVLLDSHTSVIEGSIGAIPRRLMVHDDDAALARQVLGEAGEELGDG